MIEELIGPRRPYWGDWIYDPRLRERRLRLWHRQIGYGRSWFGWPEGYAYGAARFMSSTMREEIIKCFEQYVHMTSGLGEFMQKEIIERYYRMHEDRRPGQRLDYHSLREPPYMSPYSDVRAVPKHRLPK